MTQVPILIPPILEVQIPGETRVVLQMILDPFAETKTGGEMILDNLKFRKLENGWTVKYHLAETQEPEAKRFGGEIFVKDLADLRDCVNQLIEKHMPE